MLTTVAHVGGRQFCTRAAAKTKAQSSTVLVLVRIPPAMMIEVVSDSQCQQPCASLLTSTWVQCCYDNERREQSYAVWDLQPVHSRVAMLELIRPPDIVVGGLRFYRDSSICLSSFYQLPSDFAWRNSTKTDYILSLIHI